MKNLLNFVERYIKPIKNSFSKQSQQNGKTINEKNNQYNCHSFSRIAFIWLHGNKISLNLIQR